MVVPAFGCINLNAVARPADLFRIKRYYVVIIVLVISGSSGLHPFKRNGSSPQRVQAGGLQCVSPRTLTTILLGMRSSIKSDDLVVDKMVSRQPSPPFRNRVPA